MPVFAGFLQTTHAPVNREAPAVAPKPSTVRLAFPPGPQFRLRGCGPLILGLYLVYRA
jgi:hypothetical protein